MPTLYRAEGSHDEPGYSGRVDSHTGRFFGSLQKALKYLDEDRHLYETESDEYGDPDDHVLVTPAQAAAKRHSTLCPCVTKRN